MTDIDFDELDKAVNSMIANSSNRTVDNANSNSLPSSDNQQPDSPYQPPVTQPAAPTSQIPRPPSRPLVNNPRTGRFMDVVPPTVNTRVNVAAPDTVSRQGLPVNTTDSNPTDQVSTDGQTAPVIEAPVNDSTSQQTASEWPDPINYQSETKTNDVNTDTEDADIDQISNDINETLLQKTDDVIETPFISGATVEKRPLGAFSGGVADQTQPQVTPDPVVESDTTAETVEQPVESVEPEEISDAPPVTESFPSEESMPEAPVILESAEPEVAVSPAPTEIPIPPEAPATAVPAEPVSDSQPSAQQQTSINQQYQEKPSTGDQTNGAIYDTDAYHKAILQPVKKKSGWLMVLWILLLLIVGAGSGVAVYFFVLPNL